MSRETKNLPKICRAGCFFGLNFVNLRQVIDEIDETIFCDNCFEHGVDGYAFGTGTLHFEHPNATLGAD